MILRLGFGLLSAAACCALPVLERRTLADSDVVVAQSIESFAVGLGSPEAGAPASNDASSVAPLLGPEAQVHSDEGFATAAASAPVTPLKPAQQLSVTVPTGAKPGTTLLVNVPGADTQVQVVVPANAVEGQSLLVGVAAQPAEADSATPQPGAETATGASIVEKDAETPSDAAVETFAQTDTVASAEDEAKLNAELLRHDEEATHGHTSDGTPLPTTKIIQLHKTIIHDGDEDHTPVEGDTVWVHFSGMVPATQKIFASSRFGSGAPFSFVLGQHVVISGFEDTVASMHLGQRAIVDLPPVAAYDKIVIGECAFFDDDDGCRTIIHTGPTPDHGTGTWEVPHELTRWEIELVDYQLASAG